jgi:hypothetical protein
LTYIGWATTHRHKHSDRHTRKQSYTQTQTQQHADTDTDTHTHNTNTDTPHADKQLCALECLGTPRGTSGYPDVPLCTPVSAPWGTPSSGIPLVTLGYPRADMGCPKVIGFHWVCTLGYPGVHRTPGCPEVLRCTPEFRGAPGYPGFPQCGYLGYLGVSIWQDPCPPVSSL